MKKTVTKISIKDTIKKNQKMIGLEIWALIFKRKNTQKLHPKLLPYMEIENTQIHMTTIKVIIPELVEFQKEMIGGKI